MLPGRMQKPSQNDLLRVAQLQVPADQVTHPPRFLYSLKTLLSFPKEEPPLYLSPTSFHSLVTLGEITLL